MPTHTGNVPTVARSAIGIWAWSCVVLTTVVGLATPFQYAIENALKSDPVNVRVSGVAAPARKAEGSTDVNVGTGFETGRSDCSAA